MDFFGDCQEFTKLYQEKTKKSTNGKIDRAFITKMVQDELQELNTATDEAEEIDALLDATYYLLQHLATTGIDIRPIWKEIHHANMTKFRDGHMREDGKWMKGPNFVAPDAKIRKIVEQQRKEMSEKSEEYIN